ncbi:MAG: DinB family protein [Bacteroidetes bacterium]|nr:MAG: DinB family protein [Bacteroidota bacterium]
MEKNALIAKVQDNHNAFVAYINALTEAEFMHSLPTKWTAGQQLEHILKSLKPLVKVLASKEGVAERFGTIDRPTQSYEQVVEAYNQALAKGGEASPPFLPEAVALDRKDALSQHLAETLQLLAQHLEAYSENELDTLVVPHPLLGKMTVREMLYFTAHHVAHHHQKTRENLAQ